MSMIDTIRAYWTFSDNQVHTHTWHEREGFIEEVWLPLRDAIGAVILAADAKDQPTTSVNIPRQLIERLREVAK